jgi:hypothetical protein
MVVFEYLVTLDKELFYIWRKETRVGVKILFFLNRYVVLAYASVGALTDILTEVSGLRYPINVKCTERFLEQQ